MDTVFLTEFPDTEDYGKLPVGPPYSVFALGGFMYLQCRNHAKVPRLLGTP